MIGRVRFLQPARRGFDERLLWSRDIRFVRRLATHIEGGRLLELETGTVLIAPAEELTDRAAHEIARDANDPEYGLVAVDEALPERDRYLVAMSAAVQVSGLADRIGMAQSTQVVQTKMLDYFFSLRKLHKIVYQPIVTLANGELHEYECLFRPEMPMLPQSISSVVNAAINTDRGVELDIYIVTTILEQIGRFEATARANGRAPRRYAINLMPSSLLHPSFEAAAIGTQVRDGRPGPAPDHDRMHRAAVGLGHPGPAAPGAGPAQDRLRVRGGRRRRGLRELRPHRGAATHGHQDRSRDRPWDRP